MSNFHPKNLFYLISFKCNQRCQKCNHWQRDFKTEIIPENLMANFINDIGSLEEICFVGGEPLIYKEYLLKIMNAVIDNNIRFVIVTNGLAMDKHFIEQVKGLNIHIVVSIDTLSRDKWTTFRGSDSFDQTISNLNNAIDILPSEKISIQSVLAKETISEVSEVKAFCDKKNIHHSVQYYIQDGFEGSWTAIANKATVHYSDDKCYAQNRNISILPNGDIFTCFQQSMINECQKPIGNIYQTNFKNIAQNPYTEFVLFKMSKCQLECKVLKCNQG